MKDDLFALHERGYMTLRGQPPLPEIKKHHFPEVKVTVKKDTGNVGETLVHCDDLHGHVKVWIGCSPRTK